LQERKTEKIHFFWGGYIRGTPGALELAVPADSRPWADGTAPGVSPKTASWERRLSLLPELVRQRGTRRRKAKEQEGSAPSTSAAGKNSLHPGKRVCRLW